MPTRGADGHGAHLRKVGAVIFRRKDRDAPFDPATIDLVALSPDETTVELVIVADAGWSGSDLQIRSLQEKIQSYVSFAVDGQLVDAYPDMAGRPWRIVIDCQKGSPDDRTADVVARTVEPVRNHGGDLQIRS